MAKEQGKAKSGKARKPSKIKDLPQKGLSAEQEKAVKGGGKTLPPGGPTFR